MPKRILLVEDTKNIREIVAFLLRSRGYEVVESDDGDEAWKKATTMDPDLVVLDVMLPGRTGFEIADGLKRDPRWREIPILMLTAIARKSGKSDDHWREQSGVEAFLSKPFKAAELIARVEALLGSGPA